MGEACREQYLVMNVLIDVNMGMNRTGVMPAELELLYRLAAVLPGIRPCGLHCYDGNHNQYDFASRNRLVSDFDSRIEEVVSRLKADGIDCDIIVAGGTPSFPCHARNTSWFLSPGTAFITDIVSHPAPGCSPLIWDIKVSHRPGCAAGLYRRDGRRSRGAA